MPRVQDHFGPIIILSSLVVCFGHHSTSHDGQLKVKVIEDIVRKVCNISLNAFSKKDSEQKYILMAKIEEKLKQSALSADIQGEKYVDLIMRGVRSKAFGIHKNEVFETTEHPFNDTKPDENKSTDAGLILRHKNERLPGEKKKRLRKAKRDSTSPKSKDKLVEEIASKLEILAKTYLKHNKTGDHKKVIDKIKEAFMKSAKRHPTLHNKHDDIKRYVDLVAKGLAVMMHKSKENNIRKMGLTLDNNLSVVKDIPDISGELFDLSKLHALINNEVSADDSLNAEKTKSFKFNISNNDVLNPKSQCADTVQETCNKIKLVQKFKCNHDNREIDIIKFCDGVGDCIDFSDEQNCADQAMESIQNTNKLMQYIQSSISSNCYPDAVDDDTIIKRNKILGNILRNQFTFLHRYTLDDSSQHSRRIFNTNAQLYKKIVNDAMTLVHTLSSVLETELCKTVYTPEEYKSKVIAAQLNPNNLNKDILLQLAGVIPAKAWVSELCKCDGNKCLKQCSPECEQTCSRKFTLTRFKCSAIDGDESVNLDLLCDGKLDCFDESDESGCAGDTGLGKFEATKIYNNVLHMLVLKTTAAGFESIRRKLQNLHILVSKLQKISLKRHASAPDVKHRRDACFMELLGIYETALHDSSSQNQLNDIYEFLQLLNERLVVSLKLSHSGNDKTISSDGCTCRFSNCTMLKCTKTCMRVCSVKPMLTRYFCGGSSNTSDSVPLELLCNGKMNCPGGDDENDCIPDVCRKHHLVVLRHKLRDVGHHQDGTAIGEALQSWKTKVLGTLLVAQSNERPQPFMIREMVNQILRDLVASYASLDDKRSTDVTFKEFSEWSSVVIDTIKSCTI